MLITPRHVDEACAFLANFINYKQLENTIGLVLGSGLSDLGEELKKHPDAKSINFATIPHMSNSSVQGHKGEMIFSVLENKNIIALSGRLHFYEGHDSTLVTFPIRLLGKLGVKNLILTNAAGAIGDNFEPGDIMIINDHLNLTGQNPLIGKNHEDYGPRFLDMSEAYNKSLIQKALKAAKNLNISLHEGVYAGLLGPTYETPAEVRMLKILGAHAVGMSTVLETIVARHMNINVLGLSCLSNKAAGLSEQAINHEEVMHINLKTSQILHKLIKNIICDI